METRERGHPIEHIISMRERKKRESGSILEGWARAGGGGGGLGGKIRKRGCF